jgi:hypothetical protein
MNAPLMFRPATCLIFLLAVSISSVSTAGGTRLYRWVDQEGRVHYTDTIPPSAVDQGRAVLNTEGVRVQTVPPAKSAEAVAQEAELARLRKEQQALIEKQRAADRVLLQSYRSEDDIVMARDGKIAAINVMIQVTRNNVGRQQRALAKLRSTAADLERAGKPLPPQLTQDIASIERSVRDAYAGILDRQAQKRAIYDTFGKYLKRFRELKRLPIPPKGEDEKAARPALDNIVLCSAPSECDRLWDKAVAYVRKNAATPVPASNSTILITAPPAAAEQISMILSRIQDKKDDGATLFLDLQCQQSIRGQQACSSNAAKKLIKDFRPAVMGQDGTSKS